MIRLPAPPSCPVSITCITLHSMFTGLSFTRKGLIVSAGTGVNPAFSNSFTPRGYSQLASEACWAMPYVTTLITTSLVAQIFSRVCLIVLFLTRRAGEKIRMGGWLPKTLKKLNGDKLGFPCSSTVLAKQMGRGDTQPSRY